MRVYASNSKYSNISNIFLIFDHANLAQDNNISIERVISHKRVMVHLRFVILLIFRMLKCKKPKKYVEYYFLRLRSTKRQKLL